MPRIMGLDVGKKRIGVALSDETNTIAAGLEVISVDKTQDPIKDIERIVRKYNIAEIVVGLPLNMNGSEGDAAIKVREFITKVKALIDIEIQTFDERLTTKQGEDILIQADMSRKKRKAVIDRLAAQIILQAYLDMKKIS
ncbi:MAG: Holliday junction resolvase RuvX [Candidatus Omnitrophota bacterium]